MADPARRALKRSAQREVAASHRAGRRGIAAACTRRLAAAGAGLLLAAAAGAQVPARPEALLLDIRVNDKPLAGIVRVERLADGRLALPADAWTAARLRPAGAPLPLSDGTPAHALEAAPGLVYRLDRSRLVLDITAPAAAFDTTLLSLRTALAAPTPPPPGAYLNYDLSATRAERQAASYGALVEGVAFGRWGSLVASSVVRADGQGRSAIRLDTRWRIDLPGRMATLVLGDTVGSGGAWSRPLRYAGLRYARDFQLAPGFVSYPTPSISGSAALPSTVDLLINNQRLAQSKVQPGPFEISHVPVVTGAGEMQLVVRDMLGRDTVISQSYYLAPQLLASGLSDFSFEAGAQRRHYGSRSHDYGPAFGAATYRLGLSDTLTGELRAEVERGRGAAGAGIAAVVGEFAVVAFAAGYAVAGSERGGHYVANLQRSTPRGGFSIAAEHSDRGYRPFGDGAAATRPKHQFVAGAGLVLRPGLTVGLSYAQQTPWDGARSGLVGVNLGLALPGNLQLSVHASQGLGARQRVAGGVSLTVPLGQQMLAASSKRDAAGQVANRVQAGRSLPSGPGWGWRVAASDHPTQGVEAAATYNSAHAQLAAQAHAGQGVNALRLGASGSLGWMSGLGFASRRIEHGAFAVVQVGDIEGVAVSLSNQVVAVTNRDGLALVTGLLPYQANQLTIDADRLPLDAAIGGVRETVVPYARSGAFVEFPVKRSRDALVLLQQADGTPVPGGARVTLTPGHQAYTVARRGEVYLLGVTDDSRIEVRWPAGGCSLVLPLVLPMTPAPAASPAGAAEPLRIGPLVCGGGT